MPKISPIDVAFVLVTLAIVIFVYLPILGIKWYG